MTRTRAPTAAHYGRPRYLVSTTVETPGTRHAQPTSHTQKHARHPAGIHSIRETAQALQHGAYGERLRWPKGCVCDRGLCRDNMLACRCVAGGIWHVTYFALFYHVTRKTHKRVGSFAARQHAAQWREPGQT